VARDHVREEATVGAHTNVAEWLDAVLMGWLALTLLSTMYVARHALSRNRGPAVTRWGWVLVTLYTGPIGAALYGLACATPRQTSPDALDEPRWKQALGATVRCVAGDATGVIAAAVLAGALGVPMWVDLVLEYLFGLGVGLFVFEALSMKSLGSGSYVGAVRRSLLPTWLSMNAMMAVMIPTMVILVSQDPAAVRPDATRFWGVMSLATVFGALAAYPLNWWLVAAGAMQHPRAAGAPTAPIAASRLQLVAMTGLSLLALTCGVLLAAAVGDLRMRAESRGPPAEPLRSWALGPVSERATAEWRACVGLPVLHKGVVIDASCLLDRGPRIDAPRDPAARHERRQPRRCGRYRRRVGTSRPLRRRPTAMGAVSACRWRTPVLRRSRRGRGRCARTRSSPRPRRPRSRCWSRMRRAAGWRIRPHRLRFREVVPPRS
jgi:hypothetical protein